MHERSPSRSHRERSLPPWIDAYRLHVEEEYVMNGNVSYKTRYSLGDPLRGFYRYPNKAEMPNVVFPSWWRVWKCAAYEEKARDQG